MKLKTRADYAGDSLNEPRRGRVVANRFDRPLTREELARWSDDGWPASADKAAANSWLDNLAAWISALLWKKTVLGYQDERGFHYGVPPAKPKPHAIRN